jgi:predicted PurR-regulated permease PerM
VTSLAAPPRDLPRIVFSVLAIVVLIAANLWVLRPFLPALIWATLIVVATWRPFVRLLERLGGRRVLATAIMVVALVLVFLAPVALAVGLFVANLADIGAWLTSLPDLVAAGPPGWVRDIPLIGDTIADGWTNLVAGGPQGIASRLGPHVDEIGQWPARRIGGFGVFLFDIFLTVLFAAVLYWRGERWAEAVRRFARRLAGARGDDAVMLSAGAIRAIALGVVATSLIQAFVGGLGLLIAGVPAWAILAAVMFVTSIAQVGAAPVVALATVWLFFQGSTGWGIALAVWTVVVGSLDNVVRPLLIGREAHLSFLLVFAGVLGGLAAFGPLGLFAGPVILAVSAALMKSWMRGDDDTASLPDPP